ncbi:MAG: phenylalanine--tRNA ligase subunit beta [Proteobacteria bacterium]|nr:phenylalanine--tRNA ligase subunit beta [Pseudomonadota bacterium]
MKIVLSLLQQFIALKPETTPKQLEVALIQLGHEVDAITTTGGNFPQVVVGHVLSREQHPNADRLGVCMVNVGEAAPRQIVCGAPNVRAGLTVAVALPGAVLPGNFAISASQIRGVESNGMICSQRELGLGDEHQGIWEMQTTLPVGTPLNTYFGPPETVLEVALTPNRGDCFSHLGLARDLAALGMGTLVKLKFPKAGKEPSKVSAASTTENCPQINLLTISKLKNTSSPLHVQKQLEAAGLRPKNALVDATNYTMIALGQPLHAYDAAKITGPLTAARAVGGEVFKGLGDVELTLQANDTVICDAQGVVGLGGILGGAASAVSEATTEIVLEAAYFAPVQIALSGQAHQLHTDARQRFERGTDPAMAEPALRFCAGLIKQWCGGKVSAVSTAGSGVAAPVVIDYNPSFFDSYIGLHVPAKQQKSILKELGFGVQKEQKYLKVTPPSYRTYMQTAEDLTEEILRIVGYETVPPQLPPSMGGQFGIESAPVTLDRTARKALAAAGFLEIITYSFIGDATAKLFANGEQLVTLSNPLAQTDMTTLRPSLLPGLLTALAKNLAHSENTPLLGEVGKVYTAKGEFLQAAGVMSASQIRHWQQTARQPDAFAAKAAALHTLALLGAPVESANVRGFSGNRSVPDYYHPGRSGSLQVGPFTLATFGELHPTIAKHFGLSNVAVFEVHMAPLQKLTSRPRPWQPMPYPPVHRDLAFILPREITAASVQATIKAAAMGHAQSSGQGAANLLKSAEVFDAYQGDKIPSDKQSLAYSLTLQSAEKTLTEADVAPLLKAIVQAVESSHQATLRR